MNGDIDTAREKFIESRNVIRNELLIRLEYMNREVDNRKKELN